MTFDEAYASDTPEPPQAARSGNTPQPQPAEKGNNNKGKHRATVETEDEESDWQSDEDVDMEDTRQGLAGLSLSSAGGSTLHETTVQKKTKRTWFGRRK